MILTISSVFEPASLLALALGVFGGILIGALPGLTAVMGVSILVPFTFSMQSSVAIVLLIGVFNGAVYGGSISAVLCSMPGTPSAVMTTMDGYPLCQKGQGGKAIGIATVSSFIGGVFSTICLAIVAPLLSKFALMFSNAEYFALVVFGLTVIVSLSKGSMIKGLMSGVFGVLLACVGLDPISSVPRFTYGSIYLQAGLDFVPIMIGLFGLSEIFNSILENNYSRKVEQNIKNVLPKFSEIWKMRYLYLKCALIGTGIGALPGTGGPIAAILAYDTAKNSDPDPESFGTGRLEGVAAPECANNASIGGSLIPMLTLGIPGDATTAVMMSAFALHNLQCGPLLTITQPKILPIIFIAMLIANVFMICFGLGFLKGFAKIVSFPQNFLLPVLTLLTILGSYTISNLYFHVGLMIVSGILGLVMKKLEIPPTPLVLGLVLGQMFETNFRPALMMFKGNFFMFFTRPISCILLLLSVFFLCRPFLAKIMRKSKKTGAK